MGLNSAGDAHLPIPSCSLVISLPILTRHMQLSASLLEGQSSLISLGKKPRTRNFCFVLKSFSLFENFSGQDEWRMFGVALQMKTECRRLGSLIFNNIYI